MPTYEYACTSCGHHLEVVQSFNDKPLSSCPVCGSRLRKVFGNIGIVLKGSGFYKTDSRSTTKSKSGDRSGSDGAPVKETAAKDASPGTESAKKDPAPVGTKAGTGASSGESTKRAAESG